MHLVPLRVTVEIRALDVGPRLDRVWRLTRGLTQDGLAIGKDLPWDAGRPVALTLALPDDGPAVTLQGLIEGVAPEAPERDGERARPRAVRFTDVPPEARVRLDRYLKERIRQ